MLQKNEVNSQHQHCLSQTSWIPVPEYVAPSFEFCGQHTCTQCTYVHGWQVLIDIKQASRKTKPHVLIYFRFTLYLLIRKLPPHLYPDPQIVYFAIQQEWNKFLLSVGLKEMCLDYLKGHVFYLWTNLTMMLNFDCHIDGIYNHHGNKSFSMSENFPT